jgi:hypothetical protein
MPKVGDKVFPYTKKGMADAKAFAKRTGKTIQKSNKKTKKKKEY